MGKIIVFNFVTLDGFFAGPKGEIDWHNYDAEMSKYSTEQMESVGAIIFGRTTYELMASYWPTPEGVKSEPRVAQIMNGTQKIVFSKTLKQVSDGPIWKNIKILTEIKPGEILRLKEQIDKDIFIFGSGTIVQQFTDMGLVDEYRLVVNPIILGKGKPLFKNTKKKQKLKFRETKTFKNGNVLLCYETGFAKTAHSRGQTSSPA